MSGGDGRNRRKIYWVFAPFDYGWYDGKLFSHYDSKTVEWSTWSTALEVKNIKGLKKILRRYRSESFDVSYLSETRNRVRFGICRFESLNAEDFD